MYSINSPHKIITVFIIILWAIYQFSMRNEDSLYYKNGQIKRVGNQENALNEGTWIWYFPNGVTQLKGQFSEGERTGTWYRYDSTGQVIGVSTYQHNQLNGDWIELSTKGDTIHHQVFKNDSIIETIK